MFVYILFIILGLFMFIYYAFIFVYIAGYAF